MDEGRRRVYDPPTPSSPTVGSSLSRSLSAARRALALASLAAALPFAAAAGAEDAAARIDRLLAEADRLGSQQVRRSDLALPLCREAIRLAKSSRDTPREARAWSALGSALWYLDRHEEARGALNRARPLARRTGQIGLEASILRRLGSTLIKQGAFTEADRTQLEGLELARRAEDLEEQIALLSALSVGARHQGRLAAAETHAREALHHLDRMVADGRSVPTRLLFSVPFNVGKSLAEAGDYGSAIVHFERAFAAAEATKAIGGQWHALHDSAEWYLAQGDLDRAARYFERALNHSRAHRELREPEGYTLRGLGALAEARADPAEAARRYAESADTFRSIGMHGRVPLVLAALARAQWKTGAVPAAAASAREGLRVALAQRQPLGEALARLELARQHSDGGSAVEAEREYRLALQVARANGLRPLEPVALAGLAGVSGAAGDTKTAIELYRSAADTIESIRGRILSPDLRAAFARATHATHSGLFELLMERFRLAPDARHAALALLALERERSQNLLEALREASADRRREAPEPLRQRRLGLERDVAQLQVQLWSDAAGGSQRRELLGRLDDAERALAALQGRDRALAAGNGRHAGLRWADAEELGSLQRRLEPAEALIEYGPGVAFVVTRDSLRVVDLPRIEGLDGRIEFFVRLLAGPHPADALRAGRVLADSLVAPVLAAVPPRTQRLVVAATGSLAGLPFAALPHPLRPESERATPLLETYEIAYAPSLVALADMRRRRGESAPRPLLAVAAPASSDPASPLPRAVEGALGPLPHSAREVQAVVRRIEGAPELLSNREASEASLKALPLGHFRVLHFATHALLDPEVPARSAIVLAAGSDSEDGLLQAREIYGLDLAADLVVLSACRTAAGRASSAEGLESLAQAFLYAGSRAVVGTLWDVEDEAASRLIERLYDGLAKGEAVGAALRRAQLSLLRADPYANAASWAPLLVIGDPSVRLRPAARSHSRAGWWAAGLGLAGGVAVGFGWWRKTGRRLRAAASN